METRTPRLAHAIRQQRRLHRLHVPTPVPPPSREERELLERLNRWFDSALPDPVTTAAHTPRALRRRGAHYIASEG